MPKREIEEFARLLITQVRDPAIAECDMELRPDVNSPVAKRWRKKFADGACRGLAIEMIPDCVDAVLGKLLKRSMMARFASCTLQVTEVSSI